MLNEINSISKKKIFGGVVGEPGYPSRFLLQKYEFD
jgi:hypothetical protein